MSAESAFESTARIVDVLVRTADAAVRDRLLLEACLQRTGAAAGALWRSASPEAWEPRLERGGQDLLPDPRWLRAALEAADVPSVPGLALARARTDRRGVAVALAGLPAPADAEELGDLLTTVLLVEAAAGDDPSEPLAPLPAGALAHRQLEHDVRNALASLQATHQVLELLGADLEPADRARFQEALDRECARAGALLARGIGGPRGPEAPTSALAAEVVRDVVALEEPAFAAEGVQVRLAIEPTAEGIRVSLPPEDLARVARNLLVNAREALAGAGSSTPTGGPGAQVDVRLLGEVHAGEPGVVLRVRDHGAPLPGAPLAELFRPGFTQGKPSGTGQGLAVVRGLTRSAGGSLVVERLAQGALFEVWLPAVGPRPCSPPSCGAG